MAKLLVVPFQSDTVVELRFTISQTKSTVLDSAPDCSISARSNAESPTILVASAFPHFRPDVPAEYTIVAEVFIGFAFVPPWATT